MAGEKLDDIDRGIIYLLQHDARYLSPADMAEYLPVSEGTVRNRLDKLEEQDTIRRYIPVVDHEDADFPHRIVFSCHVPIDERGELTHQALDVSGVVSVREMLTGRHNLRVLAVASDTVEFERIADALTELGLTVEAEDLIRWEYRQPFDDFDGAVQGDPEI